MSQQIAVDWSRPRPRFHDHVRGLCAVVVARSMVRWLSLPQVGQVLGRMQRVTRPATAEQGEAAVALIRGVSMRAAAGRDSMSMSAAAALVCLSHRATVHWRVGLRTPPMEMYAWIEAGGHAVGERIDVVSAYPTIVASS